MSIDGKQIDRPDSINSAIARKKPGDSVEMVIFRNGRGAKVNVPLSSTTSQPSAERL